MSAKYFWIQVLAIYVELWLDDFTERYEDTSCVLYIDWLLQNADVIFSDGAKIRLVFKRILLRFCTKDVDPFFFILCARIVRINFHKNIIFSWKSKNHRKCLENTIGWGRHICGTLLYNKCLIFIINIFFILGDLKWIWKYKIARRRGGGCRLTHIKLSSTQYPGIEIVIFTLRHVFKIRCQSMVNNRGILPKLTVRMSLGTGYLRIKQIVCKIKTLFWVCTSEVVCWDFLKANFDSTTRFCCEKPSSHRNGSLLEGPTNDIWPGRKFHLPRLCICDFERRMKASLFFSLSVFRYLSCLVLGFLLLLWDLKSWSNDLMAINFEQICNKTVRIIQGCSFASNWSERELNGIHRLVIFESGISLSCELGLT